MEIERYLADASSEGAKQDGGVFSVSGPEALKKLAHSVPPWLVGSWAAISRLVEGLDLGFGLEVSHMQLLPLDGSRLVIEER